MRWSDIPRNPSPRTLRQFAALCLVIFGLLAVIQIVKHRPTAAAIFAILALTLGPIGLLRPTLLRGVFVGWMCAAFPIGWAVSHLMMGFMYYGVFLPVGLVFRLWGRDALMLRRTYRESCWLEKPRVTDKRQYFRQF